MGGLDTERSPTARRRGHLRLLFLAPVVVVALVLAVPPLLRRYHFIGTGDSTTLDLRRGGQAARDSLTTVPPDTPIPTEFNGVPVDDYAHDGEPWAKEMLREVTVTHYVPDFARGTRLADFRSTYVNVRDGRRVSWTPPKPQLTVWFFGGSTMFGIGQRDDHTIPSEVARAAAADGIRIRAENFGVSGYVNWQETIQFAEALTLLPKPDLVVFYDGVNENGLAYFRTDVGAIDPTTMERLPLSDEERRMKRASLGNPPPMAYGPARTALMVELASTQYRRGVETDRALAAQAGIPVVHVWQPQPLAKQPHAADDELYRRLDFDPSQLPRTTADYTAIRKGSGVAPIDLTHVLDDVMVPVFFDSSHTNELGARTVATALYGQIRPELVQLDAGRQ